jgi:hypothetical protein
MISHSPRNENTAGIQRMEQPQQGPLREQNLVRQHVCPNTGNLVKVSARKAPALRRMLISATRIAAGGRGEDPAPLCELDRTFPINYVICT